MNNLNVALFPMELKWGDKQHNISLLGQAMEHLHPDTDLLVVPETFSTGFPSFGADKEEVRALAERNTGATIDTIKELAKKHSVAICGTFIADSGGSLYNRAFFIEPDGEESFADKKHLFTMANEHKNFSYGCSRLAVRFRGWNIAMVVCYDIRFPVWCRNRRNEYDLLVCVANWPKVRVNAWNQLLPARAIENLSYVAAVDCKGVDTNGFEYDGSSRVLDFKGQDISVVPDTGDFVYATLSQEKLEKFRSKFPAWRDADDFTML